MFVTKIPGLHADLAELLRMKGWKAEIVLEHSKTEELDGREYLANLKEFIAKADDVPARWVNRSMFWDSTVLWVYDGNSRDKIVGCLVFQLKESKDKKAPRLGVYISHISVLGSDQDYVELGSTMIQCLKCFLRSDARSVHVMMEDRVLRGMLEAPGLPLVFSSETQHGKGIDRRDAELMKSTGFVETRHLWTLSMTSQLFEHEF